MRSGWRTAPWACAAVTVALQIPYPLLHGTARHAVTIASVLTFAAATLTHLAAQRGVATAVRFFAAVAIVSFLAEWVGVHTGWPFGTYSYGSGLGPKALDVPILVPIAWTMMAWPAAVAARHLVSRPPLVFLVTAAALAGWDLFLDPQMVRDGHWRWSYDSESPALQGIPLTNLAGWLLVGFVIAIVVTRLVPRQTTLEPSDALPLTMFLWTYVGSIIVNAIFLSRPGIALIGGIGMGLVGVPLAVRLARRTKSRARRAPTPVTVP